MPKCPKCGQAVYHAERILAMGNEYHPQCLRCENCDTKLTQGRHSAHKSKLYCNPCYQQLFGPDGFRVGVVEPRRTPPSLVEKTKPLTIAERIELQTKIQTFNMYKETRSEQMVCVKVNDRMIYEGLMRVYWGVRHAIVLPPGAVYAKQRYGRDSLYDIFGDDEAAFLQRLEEASRDQRRQLLEQDGNRLLHASRNSVLFPDEDWREGEFRDLSYSGNFDPTQSLPPVPAGRPTLGTSLSLIEEGKEATNQVDGGYMSRSLERGTTMSRTGSQVRKRSASFRKVIRAKKKEEIKQQPERHKFTPPYGSSTNIRVASTMNTTEVVSLLLSKFKAENNPSLYTLYVVHDSGAQERCQDDDYPLTIRLKLGPSEDIAKIFIMERSDNNEIQVTEEVAEWIKFALPELEKFSKKFEEEEKREEDKLREKFERWRQAITDQITELKMPPETAL